MSRFNSSEKKKTTKTINNAGGKAYKQSSKLEIVSILLTSFLQNQYYRGANDTEKHLCNLIASEKDKIFIAKAAIFARQEYGMRSITHLVAGEIAANVKGEDWTKRFYDAVIHRPDDMIEILSYYLNTYGKPIPNSLKKGLAKAFDKFDEYQFAKYRCENKDISLVDVVNLVHPIPTAKNKAALEKLIKGDLKSFDTWESKLTQAGQNATSDEEKEYLKNAAWKELILEKKIGYFALLRNLRNIANQSPDVLDQACDMLVNKELIKKSLVLPFRFTTAYEEIRNTITDQDQFMKIARAINAALEISLENVPKFDGKTIIVLDVSGSMNGKPAQIGSLFSAIMLKSNMSDFMVFADNAAYARVNCDDSLTTIAESIRFSKGGTNFHSIFQSMNKKYDRIIILSDMQGWIGHNTPLLSFNEYCKAYNANPYIYSFDLSGYGSMQFPQDKVFAIAGFSDKIFDIMKLCESDKNALINKIDSITF